MSRKKLTVTEAIAKLGFDSNQPCAQWIAEEYLESPFPDYSLDFLQSGEEYFRECLYKRIYADIVSRSSKPSKILWILIAAFHFVSDFDGRAFLLSLKKLMSGKCCIAGCEGQSEIITYDQSAPPKFCVYHVQDGEATHSGQWINVSAYHDKWTCCDNNWKKCHCRMLDALYEPYACFIPVTQRQRDDMNERDRITLARQQEDEAFYRRQGYEESYDR